MFINLPLDVCWLLCLPGYPVAQLCFPGMSSQIGAGSPTVPGGSVVKNLSAMLETQVQSPGREDPLQKEMATHSSILAWKIPWTEEPGGLQFMELQRVRHNWETNTLTFSHCEVPDVCCALQI